MNLLNVTKKDDVEINNNVVVVLEKIPNASEYSSQSSSQWSTASEQQAESQSQVNCSLFQLSVSAFIDNFGLFVSSVFLRSQVPKVSLFLSIFN